MEVIAKLKQGYHFLDHSVQLDVSTIFSVFLWLRVYVCVCYRRRQRGGDYAAVGYVSVIIIIITTTTAPTTTTDRYRPT